MKKSLMLLLLLSIPTVYAGSDTEERKLALKRSAQQAEEGMEEERLPGSDPSKRPQFNPVQPNAVAQTNPERKEESQSLFSRVKNRLFFSDQSRNRNIQQGMRDLGIDEQNIQEMNFNQLREYVMRLQQDKQNAVKTIQDLEADKATLKQDLEKKTASLNSANEKLSIQELAAQQIQEALENKLQNLGSQYLDTYTKLATGMTQSIDKLKEDLRGEKEKSEGLGKTVNDLKIEKTALDEELKKKEQEVADAKSEVEVWRNAHQAALGGHGDVTLWDCKLGNISLTDSQKEWITQLIEDETADTGIFKLPDNFAYQNYDQRSTFRYDNVINHLQIYIPYIIEDQAKAIRKLVELSVTDDQVNNWIQAYKDFCKQSNRSDDQYLRIDLELHDKFKKKKNLNPVEPSQPANPTN